MIATGVVRGRPLFRPRMVMSPLKPSGTPAANRNLRIGLKNETHRGARAALPISIAHVRSSFLRRFVRVVTRGDPQKALQT